MLNIPSSLHKSFTASVEDFIREGQWHIPSEFVQRYPEVAAAIGQTIIPKTMRVDQLVWKASDSGSLSAKKAYCFLKPSGAACYWGKLIWSSSIPPSKSFLLWRLLHNTVPTDDQLWARGCSMVSICSLCGISYETADHVFFSYAYTSRIWSWLSSCWEITIDNSSVHSVLSILKRSWCPQVKEVILSAICYSVWGINTIGVFFF